MSDPIALRIPSVESFEHGARVRCHYCGRLVECLVFPNLGEVCARCYPWAVQAQVPEHIHHHAAPYVAVERPILDEPRPKKRWPHTRPTMG